MKCSQVLVAAAICATAISYANSYRCEESNGSYKFYEGDEEIEPKQFPCLKISNESPSTLQVLPTAQMVAPRRCSAVQDGKPSTKVKYERVEVNTGIMCTLRCKLDTGKYRCVEKAEDGECLCEPQKPQVVVRPVNSELGNGPLLGGQNDITNGPEKQTCDDKYAGYEFPDAVSCVSIRADVEKERVHFVKGKTDECFVRTGEAPETRYMPQENGGLQGCLYVCKATAPKCTGPKEDDKCECASRGLTKQLVPLGPVDTSTRLVETCNEEEGCGSCGVCKDGVCELKAEAHLGNNCECGRICPAVDERQRKTGGSIPCEPNFALECMARPDWMDSSTTESGKKMNFLDGKEVPDLCTEGSTDASDTCGCAPGYEEQLVSNDTERICVK